MELFECEEYIRTEYSTYLFIPYRLPPQPMNEEVVSYVPVKHHNVPQGELSVWRGAQVEATDGYVGLVNELLVNSNNMHARGTA